MIRTGYYRCSRPSGDMTPLVPQLGTCRTGDLPTMAAHDVPAPVHVCREVALVQVGDDGADLDVVKVDLATPPNPEQRARRETRRAARSSNFSERATQH